MVVMIPTSVDPRRTGRQPKRRSTISRAALCVRVSGVTERTRRVMTSPTFTRAAAVRNPASSSGGASDEGNS